MGTILENLEFYNNEILSFPQAKLLAVSKTKSASCIKSAYELGQRDFGENKVQELLEKSLDLRSSCPDICWHFIGSLQSNKINMLLKVERLVSIHSVDNIKLLNKLLNKKSDRKVGLFLQVNTSEEQEKAGFLVESDLFEAISCFDRAYCKSFFFQGLMTIGKIRTQSFEKDAKISFEKLCILKEKIGVESIDLSMGMSADYKIALEMQSNWIRIGSGIFGER